MYFVQSLVALSTLLIAISGASAASAGTVSYFFDKDDFAGASSGAVETHVAVTPSVGTNSDVRNATGALDLGFRSSGLQTNQHDQVRAVLMNYHYDIPIQLLANIRNSAGELASKVKFGLTTFFETKDAVGQMVRHRMTNFAPLELSASCESSGTGSCFDGFSNRISGTSNATFLGADALQFANGFNFRTELSVEISELSSSAGTWDVTASLFGPASSRFFGYVGADIHYLLAEPKPVPVPPSLVASGSALLAFGLLGFARRRRRS